MSSRFSTLHVALAAAGVIVLGGCITDADRREATRLRRPPMPSMEVISSATPPAPTEAEILAATVRQAATGNSGAAGRALNSIVDRGSRERMARQVAAELAATDPWVATKFARSLAPGPAQTAALESVSHAMIQHGAGPAIRWAVEFFDPLAAVIVRRAVADELAAADPVATVHRILALRESAARDQMLGFAAAAWARHDADGAEQWLRSLPDEETRQRLSASVGFEIAQTNPQRAIALAESLAPGRNRWLLHTAIAETWVALDAKAAFAWTNRLPAGEPRDAAVAGLDTGLGIRVTRRAGFAPDPSDGSPRGAGATVGLESSSSDGAAFAAWLATQSPGLARDEAVLAYVRQRGGLEPVTVGQWVATLPGGSTRDRAMEAFWETLLSVSPAEAAQWLRSLPRSDRNYEAIERTVREWRRTDPAAAAAWLRESSLPPERIEWLLH